MKNRFKFLAAMRSMVVIALAAIVGFSMVAIACSEDGGDNCRMRGACTYSSTDMSTGPGAGTNCRDKNCDVWKAYDEVKIGIHNKCNC